MFTLSEIEELVVALPEDERSILACRLLDTLSAEDHDQDGDGLAEAQRRSAEMDTNPSASVSHEDFMKALGRKA